jgi:hypothetical protein
MKACRHEGCPRLPPESALTSVCLAASALYHPDSGGHLWVYLNWALGMRAAGCRVLWLEQVRTGDSAGDVAKNVQRLASALSRYGLGDDCLRLCWPGGVGDAMGLSQLTAEEAREVALLVNPSYGTAPEVLAMFRRTCLIDIDPGLLQIWWSMNQLQVPQHDLYFTTGETVGVAGDNIPDCGVEWIYTPPPVDTTVWAVASAVDGAAYTTVTHWWGEWVLDATACYANGKREGFLPLVSLPARVGAPLELAVNPEDVGEDRVELEANGWRLPAAAEVAGDAGSYHRYVSGSRGEFSCVKPSCVRLQNAWISDRSLCYLAAGKPVVVEHTGPSKFLPEDEGIVRFRGLDGAVVALERVEAEYDRHARAARALAEEHFSAVRVVTAVLERAFG